MIAAGQVSVNGAPAVAGQQVTPGLDRVTVAGRSVDLVSGRTYLMMNKPIGMLTSVVIGDGRR